MRSRRRRRLVGSQAYPAAQFDNPPTTQILKPEDKERSGMQAPGLACWELVNRIVQQESVSDRHWIPLAG